MRRLSLTEATVAIVLTTGGVGGLLAREWLALTRGTQQVNEQLLALAAKGRASAPDAPERVALTAVAGHPAEPGLPDRDEPTLTAEAPKAASKPPARRVRRQATPPRIRDSLVCASKDDPLCPEL